MAISSVFDQFPILDVNETLYLRQFCYEDARAYLAYLSDPETNRFVPKECLPTTLIEAKNEIQYHLDLFNYKRSIFWAIAQKSDDKMIGSCGYNYWNQDHNRTEISYDLAREHWRKGIMSQVIQSVLSFGFYQMNLRRVEATTTEDNKASLGVLKKAGFKKEGILREQKLLHGTYKDAIMLSLLQREYLKI